MHITAIREHVVPVPSAMRIAVSDFHEMTTPIMAVVLDTRHVGHACNSAGRYACGMAVADGTLNRPDTPGTGFERHPASYALMREMA